LATDPFLSSSTVPRLFEEYLVPLRPNKQAYLDLLRTCHVYLLIIGAEVRKDGHTYSRFGSLDELLKKARERLVEYIKRTFETEPIPQQTAQARETIRCASYNAGDYKQFIFPPAIFKKLLRIANDTER
jgi:ATP-dependent DNA helicase RecG